MNKKKVKPDSEVNESTTDYQKIDNSKTIHFFSSFEEQEEFHRKQMASLTHEELLTNLERMRRLFLREHILPDGKWKPLARTIRIKTPHP